VGRGCPPLTIKVWRTQFWLLEDADFLPVSSEG
jgi:hypothetical protein